MKIFLFVRSLAVGGSQRQIALLARGLAGRGHDVIVGVLYPGGTMEADVHTAGVRTASFAKTGRWDVVGPLQRLWRLVRSERPDVVYAFLPTQNVLSALLLPPFWRPRLVFGIRGAAIDHSRYDRLSRIVHDAEILSSVRADLVIANGEAVRADAVRRGLPATRTIVIPNGIDTDAMAPDPTAGRALRQAWDLDDHFVIGMAARFDPMKDHAMFLAAAAQFVAQEGDARFVLVGDGPEAYRRALQGQAEALGLAGRVTWAGERTDMRAVYNAFDLASLSSAFGEGFPNVIGEAMACGRPVVATDVGDARAIIGDTGEVVLPGRPDLLCHAWRRMRHRLVDDADGLGRRARARVTDNYSIDLMVQRTETALASLSARSGSR